MTGPSDQEVADDFRPLMLPWQVSRDELLRSADNVTDGAMCCFVIDGQIPAAARSGYAALVIAYARADEPVHIGDDGSATLLIRSGGTGAAEVAARRVLDQMRRLALDTTLSTGIAPLRGDPVDAMERARDAAGGRGGGSISVAG